MTTAEKTQITVEATVKVPVEKAWKLWTTPEHITHWNNASDDWYTPWAENDLQAGGKFSYRMEAKDGSFGFDFGGLYDKEKKKKLFVYIFAEGKKGKVIFETNGTKKKMG